VAYMTLGV